MMRRFALAAGIFAAISATAFGFAAVVLFVPWYVMPIVGVASLGWLSWVFAGDVRRRKQGDG